MDISYANVKEELAFFDRIFKEFKGIDFFIAGGAFPKIFTGQKPNDVDMFFRDRTEVEKAIARVIKLNLKITFENDWVMNFYIGKQKYQIIKKYHYTNPKDIFKTFDFTICKFVYDGKDIFYHPRFFKDLAAKKLVIDNETVPLPLSTLKRAFKYSQRGFTLCPIGMSKLAKQISNQKIDFNNPDDNQIDFYPDGTPTFRGID